MSRKPFFWLKKPDSIDTDKLLDLMPPLMLLQWRLRLLPLPTTLHRKLMLHRINSSIRLLRLGIFVVAGMVVEEAAVVEAVTVEAQCNANSAVSTATMRSLAGTGSINSTNQTLTRTKTPTQTININPTHLHGNNNRPLPNLRPHPKPY